MKRSALGIVAVLLCGCPSSSDKTTLDLAPATGGPVGFVSVYSDRETDSARASAAFLRNGSAFLCTEITEGACTFFDCAARPNPDGGVGTPASAGAIAITGGSQAVALGVASDGYYDPVVIGAKLFAGGETLTVNAPGAGEVPAFAASLTAPKVAIVTAPALPSGDLIVDRSQDLTVSWSNAITETVRVTLGGERQLPIEVECRFPGSGGTGVVPASLLARLPAGGGFFEILTRTEEQTQAGSWTIEFRAGVYATNAAGATLVGGVELQ